LAEKNNIGIQLDRCFACPLGGQAKSRDPSVDQPESKAYGGGY
jgi:hypothetical protein